MAHINENYTKLPGSYLFAEIGRRSAAFAASHPDADIIKMGIGDVTRPLAPTVKHGGGPLNYGRHYGIDRAEHHCREEHDAESDGEGTQQGEDIDRLRPGQ